MKERMDFHEHCQRDGRTRIYHPVRSILRQVGAEGASALVGNGQVNTSLWSVSRQVCIHPGGSLLLDFGETLHGGIRLNLGPCGGEGLVRLTLGESVSESLGDPDLDSSRRKALLELPACGILEYGNTSFRFVQVENCGAEVMCCQNILAVALEYDNVIVGDFECSDERLNAIWRTSIRTVHLCMQDVIYDGAKRDRIAWMGDLHPEIRGILCAFTETDIIARTLDFLIEETPPGEPMNGIVTYSCWFVISVWEYYMGTGDRLFLERHGDYVEAMLIRYVSFVDANGVERLPGRRFLDWPNDQDDVSKHAGIQALLLWMMVSGEKLLKALGRDTCLVHEAIQCLRRHVPDSHGRKASSALLSLTGLRDCRPILEQAPLRDISTFYGYYVLLAKDTVPALELIRRYWGGMLDLGATSFWEDFDLSWMDNACGIDCLPVAGKRDIHRDCGNYCYKGLRHSLCHGWSCGPAPFLTERILGVHFLAPGGRTITCHPDLGDLTFAKGTVPCPLGTIEVEVNRCGKVHLEVPPGVQVLSS